MGAGIAPVPIRWPAGRRRRILAGGLGLQWAVPFRKVQTWDFAEGLVGDRV